MIQQEVSPASTGEASAIPDFGRSLIADAKRSTRLTFFLLGFSQACWAPLVPFARARLGVNEAELSHILLFLGLGAFLGMPVSGAAIAKRGCRIMICTGGAVIAVTLPLLATVSSVAGLAIGLAFFGASLGAIGVAANVHGTDVQRVAGRPQMSGFHGMYSVGALAGSLGMTLLIAAGLREGLAAVVSSVAIVTCLVLAYGGFIVAAFGQKQPGFAIPRGGVILIGLAAMILFLAEAAMLDWGALLMTQDKAVPVSIAGSGYVAFAFAMTISRLIGDRLVARVGERTALFCGILLTGTGILVVATSSGFGLALAGMALTGFGAGNVVPVLFSLTSQQKAMPSAVAISSASFLGYLGVLMGPALVGAIAHVVGLTGAFYVLAWLVLTLLFFVKVLSDTTGTYLKR